MPAARDVIGGATGTGNPDLSHMLLRDAVLNLNPVEGQGDAARSRRIKAIMAAPPPNPPPQAGEGL